VPNTDDRGIGIFGRISGAPADRSSICMWTRRQATTATAIEPTSSWARCRKSRAGGFAAATGSPKPTEARGARVADRVASGPERVTTGLWFPDRVRAGREARGGVRFRVRTSEAPCDSDRSYRLRDLAGIREASAAWLPKQLPLFRPAGSRAETIASADAEPGRSGEMIWPPPDDLSRFGAHGRSLECLSTRARVRLMPRRRNRRCCFRRELDRS
jgi:hypothetical protein